MRVTEENLKEMLVPPGHLSEEQFSDAVAEAEQKKVSLQEYFVNAGLISDVNLGRTIAEFFEYRFIDLHEVVIKDEYLKIIPEIVARSQRAVVYGIEGDVLNLATENIENYEFLKLLEKKTGQKISLHYATQKGIDTALKYYKGDLQHKIVALIASNSENNEEGSIIKLVDYFLEYASDSHASDIHIEPLDTEILIRFRIDGLLHEVLRYPKKLHEKIVFRIKIMSHMQTDEHTTAQDGRFEYRREENNFDVRVSILPITDGENIVMRLLDSHTHRFALENIGLEMPDYEKIMRAIEKPHGMILAVGPTGSGKTTALYTVLEKLNSSEVNIMTIEDPVEYDIEGVQQTQVNLKKDLSFATGLRTIVRQDPDIIMVGEIRDAEAADIAINAALTGHLVISTLHTNDAATTFPRLNEMKVEPFLIASSVNIIIALRLVRKICEHCKASYVPTHDELKQLHLGEDALSFIKKISGSDDMNSLRLYRGSGCKICRDSGYSGRTGIFEVLEVTEEIRTLITDEATSTEIGKKAIASGMTTLLYDGIVKALKGTTTLEEIMKVARI